MTPAKQPVSRLRLFLRSFGWLALIPLLIALITVLIAASQGRKAARLRDNGVVATAEIVDKEINITTNSDGDRSTTYTLTFRFADTSGTITDQSSVGRGFYNRLSIGDSTEIRYWREDPKVNEIEPGATEKTILITGIISAVLLAIGSIATVVIWAKVGRILRVRDRGLRRKAEVESHFRTKVRVNNRSRWRLVWRDHEGAEGKSFLMKEAGLAAFPLGTQLWVYVDPRGKQAPVWEGDVGPARRAGAVRRA